MSDYEFSGFDAMGASDTIVVAAKVCLKCGSTNFSPRGICRPCDSRIHMERARLKGVKPRSVYGVGEYKPGAFNCTDENGVKTKVYALWHSMIQRGYAAEYKEKFPTYETCSVSEGFKTFQVFAAWAVKQVGFGLDKWELDKDLLFRGNKCYAEDTCVFLPMCINYLLLNQRCNRGKYPIGVSKDGGVFRASCQTGDRNRGFIGSFPTPELAFARYKEVKEAYIKQRAEQFKHQIDPRAYAALMAYEILITD